MMMMMMMMCFLLLFIDRTKDFDKSSDYANAWKSNEDGKVNSDGPRMVVADQSQVPSGGFVTRQEDDLLQFCLFIYSFIARICTCIAPLQGATQSIDVRNVDPKNKSVKKLVFYEKK